MIELKNISVKYGKNIALNDVNVNFPQGEFTAILGSNGAGKSTLIKIASGWLKQNSGVVKCNNKDLQEISTRDLADMRAVLEQECPTDFDYTVSQILEMASYRVSPFGFSISYESFASSALELVELKGFENRLYTKLSGGESRRVQLARAICQIGGLKNLEGKNLLLDEPVASLDPSSTHCAMSIARRMADNGCCVIAVLHDVNLALQYCQNAILLKNGKVLAKGKTEEIITSENLSETYSAPCEILDTHLGKVVIFPKKS